MRVGSLLAAGCAAAIALMAAGTASAEPRTHDGFFLRLGLNLGPMIVNESYEFNGQSAGDDGKITGFSTGFDLLLGGTLAPGFVLGGGLLGVTTSNPHLKRGPFEADADGTMILAGAALFANYYFDPTQGFNLQGLVGYGALDYVDEGGASGGNDPSGIIFGIGAGYDFWISDQWSIGPFGRVLMGSMSASAGGAEASQFILYPNIGVAFTLH